MQAINLNYGFWKVSQYYECKYKIFLYNLFCVYVPGAEWKRKMGR